MRTSLLIGNLKGGGAEKVAILLANGLAARGIQADLIVLDEEGDYLSSDLISERVNRIYLNPRREPNAFRRRLGYILKLRKYVSVNKPDVMITFGNASDWLGCLARYFFKYPAKVVTTVHYAPSAYFPVTKRGHLWQLAIGCIYHLADQIVAVSQENGRDTEKYFYLPQRKVRVIYNPVISPEIIQLTKADVNHPWFQASNTPVILSVGSFCTRKNYPMLLRAFALVRKRCDCKLVLLGEGEDRASLERLVNELEIVDDVSLPGFVDNPYAYMSKAGLFVLSSLSEALPNVLIEALACGCPVISSDCPTGPKEILQNGKFGALVPMNDIQAMADAMIQVIEAGTVPCTRQERIARGQDFLIDKASSQYLALLSDMAR